MVKLLNGFDLPGAANDDFAQRKSGVFVPRTPAQVKTDLALVKGDVGLGSVDNTSDAAKPISTLTQAALNTKIETVSGFGAIHVGPGGSLNLTVTADDANSGQSGFLSRTGYDKLVSLALDNRVATTAPTVNDDSADGYVVGSLWLNVTLDIAYVCLDSTVGAAIWKRMQEWDADLETLASLTATTDSFLQSKSSNWAARTIAQVRADLAVPVLIAEATVGVGGVASVTFSSIPQTYRDLVMTWSALSASGITAIDFRYNGDTAANYDWQRLSAFNTTTAPAESIGATSARFGTTNAVAASFGAGEARIYEYTRTDRKKLSIGHAGRLDGQATNNIVIERNMAAWRTSNAAITSLTVLGVSANLAQNSIFRLFGCP